MLIRLRQHLTYANVGTTVALVLGASGFAVAAAPKPSTKPVRACASKQTGILRLRTAGERCRKTERAVSWNRVGPRSGYTKAQSEARYLAKAAKAADAEALDGVDSTGFLPSRRFAGSVPRAATVEPRTGPDAPCQLGTMIAYAGTTPPNGWSFAHGQTLFIADNVPLATLLGTRYGGDPTTGKFALPDAYDLGPGGTSWIICTGGA